MKRWIASLALALFATTAWAQVDWEAVFADPVRPAADVEEDAERHAREVLEFFGVEQGDHVADILSGGGYYTQLLAIVVGPEGKVYAGNNPFFARFTGEAFNARFEGDGFANVVNVDGPVDELPLPPNTLDFVLMNNVYHDVFLVDEDRAEMNRIVFEALKPGGILGVVDHAAAPGTPVDQIRSLHRIDKQVVIDDFTVAGFELVDENKLFANPEDRYDVRIFDESVRGNTDRFMLKFQKPAE